MVLTQDSTVKQKLEKKKGGMIKSFWSFCKKLLQKRKTCRKRGGAGVGGWGLRWGAGQEERRG